MSYEFDFGHRKFFSKKNGCHIILGLKFIRFLHSEYKHTMKLETNLVEYLSYTNLQQ